jgi:hypothetical protein
MPKALRKGPVVEAAIKKILTETLLTLSEDFGKPELSAESDQLILFGENGILTSIELVALIADLEDRLFEQLNASLVLADEKAMSQRNSPFKNVENLTAFIALKIQESQAA